MTKPKPKEIKAEIPAPVKAPAMPAAPPAKKRGQYKKVECPYCHAMVGNLGNHVQQKHKGQAPPPPGITKEDMLGIPAKPQEQPPEIKAAKQTYYCTTCAERGYTKRAVLRLGEESCWQCGAILNWEGIDNG